MKKVKNSENEKLTVYMRKNAEYEKTWYMVKNSENEKITWYITKNSENEKITWYMAKNLENEIIKDKWLTINTSGHNNIYVWPLQSTQHNWCEMELHVMDMLFGVIKFHFLRYFFSFEIILPFEI